VIATSTRRRFLIIHNREAGTWHRRLLSTVSRCLEDGGAELRIEHAAGIEQGRELVRSAVKSGGFDAVVAAGGDSTIRGVASALIGSALPLGIIPVGTGNVLANEIGLGRDPGALADVLLHGPTLEIRCGLADDTPFLLMVGAGFDAHVVKRLSTPWKRSVGKLAYTWPIVREILRKPKPFDVVIDGHPVRATWLVVTRVAHYGGSFVIADQQSLTGDGFHAVFTNAESRRAFAGVLMSIALGRHALRRDVTMVACKQVSLPGAHAIAAQLDGEPAGPSPCELTLSHKGLNLLVPQGSPLARHAQTEPDQRAIIRPESMSRR
jgi:diacylglycerol kinase (ATP)